MADSLKTLGVALIDASAGIYGCLACGHRWAVMLRHGGRRPRGWWHCPEGCNHD